MNHQNLSKEEWSNIIYGLRKKLNLSHSELAKIINCHRCTILRWEQKQKSPLQNSIKKISNFIEENQFNFDELMNLGKECTKGFSKDMTKPKLNLNYSEELAELIGIILGDGEIMKDGTIRISFDPKKEQDFLKRRLFPLINNLLGNKISFESNKRIAFYNISFVRFLKEDCNLKAGSKFEHNWEIPRWCFNKKEYLSAVLRGLFDTDGYFGCCQSSVEVMYGRFSDKCTNLVSSIESAMNSLGLYPSIQHTKDGRFKIRLSNKQKTIDFFNIVGTSNLKHIVRFLLWRISRYEAKIELEGLGKLINLTNNLSQFNVEKTPLPFYWNKETIPQFKEHIDFDNIYLDGLKIRKLYKWTLVLEKLVNQFGAKNLAQKFNITSRSIRKWRQGTRIPSPNFILPIIELCERHNIKLNEYKMPKQTVEALVEGGKASAAPPLGPAL